ncbi:MAG TPA: CDGSH iron-sulfur domain-containing protein [Candidatus Binataceae bacterium]|nr:CDGSH iron-sulfur domain-containing protein [Candidatus Binataceae bacterium]
MSDAIGELKELLLDIRRDLGRLKDLESIKNLITSYARGCDRGNDPALIAPLFAADGSWECAGFGTYHRRENLAAALKGIAGEKIWWSLHYMISPQIELDSSGAGATAFWYLWESATIPDSDTNEAEPHWIGGTYDVELVKQGEQWLFRKMVLKLNIASPYAAGWVRQRFPKGNERQPYFRELEPDSYFWCACGRSKNQPFCDGSHKGTSDRPVELNIEQRQLVVLCGCKRTGTRPFCDGTHLNLKLEKNGG